MWFLKKIFKFELANEVAVLESAEFELSNEKGLAWISRNLTTGGFFSETRCIFDVDIPTGCGDMTLEIWPKPKLRQNT